ncbi:hypothetical protein ABFS82_13G136800 [Erythranthe guttata]
MKSKSCMICCIALLCIVVTWTNEIEAARESGLKKSEIGAEKVAAPARRELQGSAPPKCGAEKCAGCTPCFPELQQVGPDQYAWFCTCRVNSPGGHH